MMNASSGLGKQALNRASVIVSTNTVAPPYVAADSNRGITGGNSFNHEVTPRHTKKLIGAEI